MEDNPVELVLEGAKYVLEIVNFMMFICEETCQASSMAFGTAMNNLKLDLAQHICETTLGESNVLLEGWVLSYGMLFAPSWKAFWTFGYVNDSQIIHQRTQLGIWKKYQAMGIDPRTLKMKQKIV